MNPETWHVTSFYRFIPIAPQRLQTLQSSLETWLAERQVRGLVLVAPEGVNGTVAGEEVAIVDFKQFVSDELGVGELGFKDSSSGLCPFKRLTVDIRQEIVGMKRPDLVPEQTENQHLTPREWHELMSSEQPMLLIDTRNRYETALGKFQGATDPNLKTFSEWGDYLKSADLPHDLPVMLYCTGGIRCEKAILEMRAHGFEKVFQLRNGILGYLAEYPDGYFDGECFVFDDRVSLGPDLLPTGNYGICPGCGLTSGEKRECEWCGSSYFVCSDCEPTWKPVCSKTCLDRWQRHGKRAPTLS